MKLTNCKPGMRVWWFDGCFAYAAVIVRAGKARVTIKYDSHGRYMSDGLRTTSVSPANLYRRTIL